MGERELVIIIISSKVLGNESIHYVISLKHLPHKIELDYYPFPTLMKIILLLVVHACPVALNSVSHCFDFQAFFQASHQIWL